MVNVKNLTFISCGRFRKIIKSRNGNDRLIGVGQLIDEHIGLRASNLLLIYQIKKRST